MGPGKLVGFNVKVSVGDKILFDSYKEKPVAFKSVSSRSRILCLRLQTLLPFVECASPETIPLTWLPHLASPAPGLLSDCDI